MRHKTCNLFFSHFIIISFCSSKPADSFQLSSAYSKTFFRCCSPHSYFRCGHSCLLLPEYTIPLAIVTGSFPLRPQLQFCCVGITASQQSTSWHKLIYSYDKLFKYIEDLVSKLLRGLMEGLGLWGKCVNDFCFHSSGMVKRRSFRGPLVEDLIRWNSRVQLCNVSHLMEK